MGGICGLMDMRRQGRADPALVRQMAALIRHRGPDGDGFYDAPDVTLGMRRLSIIDVAGSNQPLYNEQRTIVLVFNGEIYNYRELRHDLKRRNHGFNTDGDGETIIHLYEDHGLNLFSYLRGMYAFALWDSAAERLVLAVDHTGMKPLYLHERDGRLWFASEIKALLADPTAPRELNLDVLDTYLSFGYMIGADTLFRGVRRLPPGHAYVADKGGARLHPFWEFGQPSPVTPPLPRQGEGKNKNADPYNPANDGLIFQETRDLLADAVRLHLRSDVPLGLFLSGGMDSAALLALLAQEAGGRVQTYTVGYNAATPDNELLHARRIAEHFKTDHHERVITAEDWWRGFEKAIYHHDEPIANPAAVALLLLAEDTARQVKVALSGLGGDELFAGYPTHHAMADRLARREAWGQYVSPPDGIFAPLAGAYPALKRGALPRLRPAALSRDEAGRQMQSFDDSVFSDTMRAQLYGPELLNAWQQAQHKERTYAAIIEKSWHDDPYNTAQALIIHTSLAGNTLLSLDKVTMAAALEGRVPFFDPVLLKFAARVPTALRMRSNKIVLREAMRPLLPEFALESPQQPAPLLSWFDNELSPHLRAALTDPNSFISGLLNRAALDTLLKEHFWRRTVQPEVIYRLLTLELWAQRFIKPVMFEAG